ncbi:hypothetical protein FG386_001530 [Cryptosporidium ryanae]|uniref:uncharacterized protein n=1 Tax=Cryptosporidium ryanae TaxID=515981 RepID=UPI00351A5BFB|nr:hypothetical protein FG386_001530 [Cryptosporidium ryanae]
MSIIVKYVTLVIITILSTTVYYINFNQYPLFFYDKSVFLEINNLTYNNNNKILSNNVLINFENLPDYIKNFENTENKHFELCREYWNNDIELIFNKYLSNTNINSIKPSIQTEYTLNYINNTSINDDITLIKIRLKFKYNKKIPDYYILPIVYCINDERIKLNKYKFRDINHTIKYINKAIKINNLNKSENEYNETKNIDLLIHYDDCPIIWNSIPYTIIHNNSVEYEKCILKSKLSKEIQRIITNNTIIEREYNLNKYSDSKHNFAYITKINEITFKSKIIDIYNNSIEYICDKINEHINNIIFKINNENINEDNNALLCFGTIQCYLPCYYNNKNDNINNSSKFNINNNDVYSKISHKLKKNQIDIFKVLHCICKPDVKNNENLFIHSVSTHNNTLDLGTIPYVNHLDNNEIIIRSLFVPNNTNWRNKNDTLFFIGRYTDTFRLDLSCIVFNLLSNNYYNNTDENNYNLVSNYINNQVYISDSNKISCNNRAKFLENKVKCDKDFICRNSSLSLNEWVLLLLKSKFSLDLSGVGPWSNRLRMLLLFGISIIQNNRSFISNQFYDLPLKKNNLIFNFNNAYDIINNINLINKNPLLSEKISNITSNFSLHCLSENGLILYYKILLNKLIYYELSPTQSDFVSYIIILTYLQLFINLY